MECSVSVAWRIFRQKKTVRFTPNCLRINTPDARFELATNGLTVRCSTAELIRNNYGLTIDLDVIFLQSILYIFLFSFFELVFELF